MAKYHSNTSMGGKEEFFPNTDWSQIHRAKDCDQIIRTQIVNNLITLYWKPAYCYLRKKGCDNERAKDLTQGFFFDMVFNGQLIQSADKDKGRFRDLLQASLKNYFNNDNKKQNAQKNRPESGILSIDDVKVPEIPQQEELDEGQTFVYAWLADLLDEVMASVRQYYINRV